jgi:hypothetical protein
MKRKQGLGAITLKDVPLELRQQFRIVCLQNRVSMRNAFLAFMNHCVNDPKELRALILEDVTRAIAAAKTQAK